MKKYKNFNYACKGDKNMGIPRLKKIYLSFQKFKSLKENFLIWKEDIKKNTFILEFGSYFDKFSVKTNKLIYKFNEKNSIELRKKVHCRGYP